MLACERGIFALFVDISRNTDYRAEDFKYGPRIILSGYYLFELFHMICFL